MKSYNYSTRGYDYSTDPETGKTYAVRRATGEVIEATTITVPVGSYIKTPEDQEADKIRREGLLSKQLQDDCRNLRNKTLKKLGQYYFAVCNDFSGLSDAAVARLIFIETFLSIDGHSMSLTQRTPLNVRDLPRLMMLSGKTVSRFLKEVQAYIAVDHDGNLRAIGDVFRRGELQKGEYVMMQRIYRDSVRQLYRETPNSKHHLLGIIFRMIPYINLEYNILCRNPFEGCLQDIEPLPLFDFYKLTGYSFGKLSRLRSELRKLTFDFNGRRELFCSFVDAGFGTQNIQIFVNPHILYNGGDYTKVEVLGKFCEL